MKPWNKIIIRYVFCLCLLPVPAALAEPVVEKIKKPVEESITIRQKTQKDIEKWSEKKSLLESEYDLLTENQKRLLTQSQHLMRELEASREQIARLESQIAAMEKISEKLVPFLNEIYEKLVQSVDEPMPFLQEERFERLANLKKTLDDSQIAMGEKFRKVMEALSIEVEYGNTVEVYQEKIFLSDEEILVNVLRLGRISLFFESLDEQTTGYYDPAENQWKRLPQSANRDIRMAVEIGSRRRPADIVTLPLGRIVIK
ncbi:MAG: DUF3450 domain-containing protein [Desulfobacterales bacterium]